MTFPTVLIVTEKFSVLRYEVIGATKCILLNNEMVTKFYNVGVVLTFLHGSDIWTVATRQIRRIETAGKKLPVPWLDTDNVTKKGISKLRTN